MVSPTRFVGGIMSDATDDSRSGLAGDVRQSLHRFLEVYQPLRSDLYRYCRYLTRSPWDAEDLAQDTMARAFVTLGRMGESPPNPQAWLFRVASNLWIDAARRSRLDAPAAWEGAAEPGAWQEPRSAREAGGTLIARLAPQERAAVVLKDVFDLKVEEIAETLSTSVGAVNAALHRARRKLVESAAEADLSGADSNAVTSSTALTPSPERLPAPGVLDAFCRAFNARDLPRLTSLLLDTAAVEVVGTTTGYGLDAAAKTILRGMLFGSERLARADTLGGIDPAYMRGVLPDSPRAEVRLYRGEPIVLLWYHHQDGEAVRAINRVDTDGDRVAGIQNYFFNPDFLVDVCTELGVPFRPNGYRFWLTGC
jgi:RNA polymerase sigma-70 factor (ECF subfamily)